MTSDAEFKEGAFVGPQIRELVKKMVKQSRNRPGVTQRVPGSLGSRIFTTFGT